MAAGCSATVRKLNDISFSVYLSAGGEEGEKERERGRKGRVCVSLHQKVSVGVALYPAASPIRARGKKPGRREEGRKEEGEGKNKKTVGKIRMFTE